MPSSAEVARKFLNEEKLERSEVIKAIEQDLGTRDPQAFNQWNTKRLEVWQNLQTTAHLSWFALELGAHTRHGRTFFGHDLNKRTALYLAVCYLDAALYGTLCLGQALQDHLHEGQPWSEAQRAAGERLRQGKLEHRIDELLEGT